jgi:hypothetical protein
MTIKKLFLSAAIVYLAAAGASYAGLTLSQAPSPAPLKTTTAPPPQESQVPAEPATEECPINGMMLGKSAREKWEKRRPLAVVIENHQESRPQSGISSADVVYEGVAEGGVTRTLSIFYCQDAKYVGPIRSARVHFINLLREWGQYPLYAHVGGANCHPETGSGCGNGAQADALGLIRRLRWNLYNDLNQFSIPYPYFYRDYDRLPNVATEHTVYSSTEKLWKYAAEKRALTQVDEKGVRWDDGWKPWTFADDAPSAQRGNTRFIRYHFYDTNARHYGVEWRYDTTTNSYLRFNGGKEHTDKNNGKQLTAKNVFVMLAAESPANDNYPGGRVLYKLTGTGDAYIFQNGQAVRGTWTKKDLDSKIIFADANGKEVSVVRGQVWISLLPKGNDVYYGETAPSQGSGLNVETKTPAGIP